MPERTSTSSRPQTPSFDICVAQVVALAPPLTPEQRDRIAAALRPGTAA